ncbi:hypothetical protein WMF38_48500 [Sorangium sp. So ce118]
MFALLAAGHPAARDAQGVCLRASAGSTVTTWVGSSRSHVVEGHMTFASSNGLKDGRMAKGPCCAGHARNTQCTGAQIVGWCPAPPPGQGPAAVRGAYEPDAPVSEAMGSGGSSPQE